MRASTFDDKIHDYTELKIVLLGDAGVGKTSIISRYISNSFDSEENPTVGAMFFSKNLKVDGLNYKIRVNKSLNF